MSEPKHISVCLENYGQASKEKQLNEAKRRLSILRNDMEEYYSDQLDYELKDNDNTDYETIKQEIEDLKIIVKQLETQNNQFKFQNVIKKM